MPYKWVEDQLTRIVAARANKAEEATKECNNALLMVQELVKEDPGLRKKLSISFGPNNVGINAVRNNNGGGNKRKPQNNPPTPTKKQKPTQQARQNKTGPQYCR